MKIASLLFFSLLFFFAFSASASAEEKASKQPRRGIVVVKAPFENHWDAKSWEAGSHDFWNKKENDAPAQARPAPEKSPAPASGK